MVAHDRATARPRASSSRSGRRSTAGRRGRDVGAPRAPGAHRRRRRCRRPCRATVHARPAPRRARLPGARRSRDALDMGALAAGRRPGDRRDRGHPRGRRPAADDGRSRGPGADRGRAAARRGARAVRCRRHAGVRRADRTGSGGGWAGSSSRRSRSSGPAAHEALAREVAERSITLVRDDAGLLPLRLSADARVVVVQPAPRDLTPADTSSSVPPLLAAAIRRRHPRTEEIVVQAGADFAAIRAAIAGADLLVLGTVSASLDPAQAAPRRRAPRAPASPR